MTRLSNSLQAWGKPDFNDTFKQEVSAMDCSTLPLDKALSVGSAASAENLSVMLLSQTDMQTHIQVKAGIFFSSVIAGCNCADDPTPVDEINEYCELLFEINKNSAEVKISIA